MSGRVILKTRIRVEVEKIQRKRILERIRELAYQKSEIGRKFAKILRDKQKNEKQKFNQYLKSSKEIVDKLLPTSEKETNLDEDNTEKIEIVKHNLEDSDLEESDLEEFILDEYNLDFQESDQD